MITFRINQTPKMLQRNRKGKYSQLYDPSKEDKQSFALECLQYRPKEPFNKPIKVIITFCYKLPKYLERKKSDPPLFKTTKPDIDNLEKFVFDALTGIFWTDDNIIAATKMNKIYAKEDGYVITIEEL